MIVKRHTIKLNVQQRVFLIAILLSIFVLASDLLGYSAASKANQPSSNYHLLFQSPGETRTPTPQPHLTPTSTTAAQTPETAPLPVGTPTTEKPSWWVGSGVGGERQFGVIRVLLPPGFTSQGGASVFGDVIIGPTEIVLPSHPIIGTQFAFGIWPPQDQIDYQKPIEFRITLDAAQVAPGTEGELAVMMYNPDRKQWEVMASQFRPETYQLVTYIQSFKPMPKTFPNWGGRTFFIVAYAENNPAPPISGTSVNRNANLRAGPGVTYAIVGQAAKGQSIQLTAKSADGRWYQVDSGAWIAAFLVDNAPALPVASVTPTPLPATPTPTPTLTPNP